MTDRRPERVYGILVREGQVFLRHQAGALGLPGGVFRPLADHRKNELKAHLYDQLGILADLIWAQGAFDYQAPGEAAAHFSGFYSIWGWEGEIPGPAGVWLDKQAVIDSNLAPSLRILLVSVLDTLAMRTT
ncbi:MAG: hypothetical protein M0R74_13675 [Dehalococcoidia bacterium]|nr:hypothetical protein [Dehalococcoidia bacterium]